MTKHVHAELMMQYAQDAIETDKPWERWQSRSQFNSSEGLWRDCRTNPAWCEGTEYRRKPRTININGYEVPEPVREPLKVGNSYYRPIITRYESGVLHCKWYGSKFDQYALKTGLVHLTKEAAEIHARALLSFTAKGESDE